VVVQWKSRCNRLREASVPFGIQFKFSGQQRENSKSTFVFGYRKSRKTRQLIIRFSIVLATCYFVFLFYRVRKISKRNWFWSRAIASGPLLKEIAVQKNSWGYLLKRLRECLCPLTISYTRTDRCSKHFYFQWVVVATAHSRAFWRGKKCVRVFPRVIYSPVSPCSGLVHDYLSIPKRERRMLTALSGTLDSIPVVFARQWIPRLRPHFRLLSTS